MLLIAAILAVAAVYHYFMLPPGSKAPDAARSVAGGPAHHGRRLGHASSRSRACG